MGTLTDQSGKQVALGKQLGRGGEGSVYEVNGEPQKVTKIFIPEKRPYYGPRLAVLIPNPPEDPTRNINHISICWPERMLFENRKFVGYIMPRIQSAPDIFKVYAPKLREKELPHFNWRYLHHTAFNLACSVNAYHKAGYVIGDLNSKNVKVNARALVTMIDADSIQIPASAGEPVMRCPVGTPDFTPPELQSVKLDTIDRTVHHDAFALGVMIFLLLMEGQHPYSGAPVNPGFSVPGPVYQYCIKKGIFPYQANQFYKPPTGAPDFSSLDPDLQRFFLRCFVDGHRDNTLRPLAVDWAKALQAAENNLVKCPTNMEHWYSRHMAQCPWCKRDGILAARKALIQKQYPHRLVQRPLAAPRPPTSPPIQQPSRSIRQPTPPPPAPVRQPTPPPAPKKQPQPTPKPAWGRRIGRWISFIFVAVGLVALLFLGGGMAALGVFPAGSDPAGNENQPAATDPAGSQLNVVDLDNLPPRSGYCVGAPTLLLEEGDRAKVVTATSLTGRLSPEISETNISARYEYGDILDLYYGPVCVNSTNGLAYWFWLVSDADGKKSWVAEGDMQSYFLRLVK